MSAGRAISEAAAPAISAAAAEESDRVRIVTPRTGWIVGVERGSLLIDYPGNTHGAIVARTTVPVDAKTALAAAASRQGALLVFEDGDPGQPVVIGLVQPAFPTLIDLVLEEGDPAAASTPAEGEAGDTAAAVASADGKTRVIEGEEEVTLRCGAASISLRRDGRVVVRGAYVETHASGTNRIKGGSVRIN